MSELDDRLKSSVRITVHLAAIEYLRHLPFWSATQGQAGVYQTALAGDVLGVLEEGSASLAPVATVAACQAEQGSYYHDRSARVLYVNPNGADPYQSTMRARMEIRAGTLTKVHEGAPYPGRLTSSPTISIEESASFGDLQVRSSGTVKIDNPDGRYDPLLSGSPQKVAFKLGVDLP